MTAAEAGALTKRRNSELADWTAERLLALPESEFRSLVEADIRGRSAELRDLLRSPAVIGRLYVTLLQMQKSVEGQLAARKEDMEYARRQSLATGPSGKASWEQERANYARWRAGSLRFKEGVERLLIEIRHRREEMRQPNLALFESEANQRLLRRVTVLEAAIAAHKHAMLDDEEEPTNADLTLWSALDQ